MLLSNTDNRGHDRKMIFLNDSKELPLGEECLNPPYEEFERNLPQNLREKLFDHQKVGVRWLYKLHHHACRGGILGDDMGLGKTIQVSAFLLGLAKLKLVSKVLIVAPVSVLASWKRELTESLLSNVRHSTVTVLSADTQKKKRQLILKQVFAFGHCQVILTSYQLLASMEQDYLNGQSRRIWDYVILDEGHLIKNPNTKMSKVLKEIESQHRLVLSGTPIQNNLKEYYELVSYATFSMLLGSAKDFKIRYSDPIVAGQDPKASDEVRQRGLLAADQLSKVTRPIHLQRKKSETEMSNALPSKHEFVIWIPLSTSQRNIYQSYVNDHAVRDRVALTTGSNRLPVEIINHLKVICRHPLLLEATECNKARRKGLSGDVNLDDSCLEDDHLSDLLLGMDLNGPEMLTELDKENKPSAKGQSHKAKATRGSSLFDVINRRPNSFEIMQGSVKLRLLLALVKYLHRSGNRMLIFSQSKLMLDIIQLIFAENGLSTCRIDGDTPGIDRQRIIDSFNDCVEGASTICLLTTRACGTGITLTGADRVIVFDPSWNPAEDRQAVDRAYRIGQTKEVIVYRLIMAGTVEEKIYEKQVFKDGVRVITENGVSSRYVSESDTRDLFTLGRIGTSVVMDRLKAMSDRHVEVLPEPSSSDLKGDLEYQPYDETQHITLFALGITRHDTLYSTARRADCVDAEIQKPDVPKRTISEVPAKPIIPKPSILLNIKRNTDGLTLKNKEIYNRQKNISEPLIDLTENAHNDVMIYAHDEESALFQPPPPKEYKLSEARTPVMSSDDHCVGSAAIMNVANQSTERNIDDECDGFLFQPTPPEEYTLNRLKKVSEARTPVMSSDESEDSACGDDYRVGSAATINVANRSTERNIDDECDGSLFQPPPPKEYKLSEARTPVMSSDDHCVGSAAMVNVANQSTERNIDDECDGFLFQPTPPKEYTLNRLKKFSEARTPVMSSDESEDSACGDEMDSHHDPVTHVSINGFTVPSFDSDSERTVSPLADNDFNILPEEPFDGKGLIESPQIGIINRHRGGVSCRKKKLSKGAESSELYEDDDCMMLGADFLNLSLNGSLSTDLAIDAHQADRYLKSSSPAVKDVFVEDDASPPIAKVFGRLKRLKDVKDPHPDAEENIKNACTIVTRHDQRVIVDLVESDGDASDGLDDMDNGSVELFEDEEQRSNDLSCSGASEDDVDDDVNALAPSFPTGTLSKWSSTEEFAKLCNKSRDMSLKDILHTVDIICNKTIDPIKIFINGATGGQISSKQGTKESNRNGGVNAVKSEEQLMSKLPARCMTERMVADYNSYITAALKLQAQLSSFTKRRQRAGELGKVDMDRVTYLFHHLACNYVHAIELCDEDISVHRKLHYINTFLCGEFI